MTARSPRARELTPSSTIFGIDPCPAVSGRVLAKRLEDFQTLLQPVAKEGKGCQPRVNVMGLAVSKYTGPACCCPFVAGALALTVAVTCTEAIMLTWTSVCCLSPAPCDPSRGARRYLEGGSWGLPARALRQTPFQHPASVVFVQDGNVNLVASERCRMTSTKGDLHLRGVDGPWGTKSTAGCRSAIRS